MINLNISELSKSYSVKEVFSKLSIEYTGGKIGVAGSNGAGKSTLLRCISGLILPDKGTVTWSVHEETLSPKQIKPHLGYAAPYVELYEELTARENLQFIRDLRSDQDCEKISNLIHQFQLTAFADSLYGELSSGQQQRVKLASAVVHKPSILCLDEPGTNLDEKGHAIVEQMTQKCVDSGGIVILASNQKRELDICDVFIQLKSEVLK